MKWLFILLVLVSCNKTETPAVKDVLKNKTPELTIELGSCYGGRDSVGDFYIKILKIYKHHSFYVDIVQKTNKVTYIQEYVFVGLNSTVHKLEKLDCEAFDDIKKIELEFQKKNEKKQESTESN